MSGTITANLQNTYPPRYLLTITGALSGPKGIYRVQGSTRTLVRGTGSFSGVGTFIFADAEIPFGVPFTYEYMESGTTVSTIGPFTAVLTGGMVALTDSITGAAAEVTITAMGDRESQTNMSVFNVDGKNRTVAGVGGQFQASYEYLTFTTSSAANLASLLKTATEAIIQQRQPGGYDRVDDFLAVIAFRERRFSQDGSDPRRYWAVDVAQSDGWAPIYVARQFSYQDLANTFTGLTYADVASAYPTYLAVAQGDYS